MIKGEIKMKKKILKCLCVVFSLLMLVSLSACSNMGPEETFNEYMHIITTGEDAEKLFEIGTMERNSKELFEQSGLSVDEYMNDITNTNIDEDTQNKLTSKLSYKIVSVKQNESTATLTVEFTNIDYSTLMDNIMDRLFDYSSEDMANFSEEKINEHIEKLYEEEVNKIYEKGKIITVTGEVNMIKENGTWMVESSPELYSMIYGQMLNYKNMDSFNY